VLDLVKDTKKLVKREQYWLDKYKAAQREFGFNARVLAHSNHGVSPSKETREKIAAKLRGTKLSAATCRRLSIAQRKVVHTAEWNEAIRKAHKGRVISAATREKIRKKLLGRKPSRQALINMKAGHTEAVKKQQARSRAKWWASLSEAQRAEIYSKVSRKLRGVKRSAATRKRMSNANRNRPASINKRIAATMKKVWAARTRAQKDQMMKKRFVTLGIH
jgi:hypothetical protein